MRTSLRPALRALLIVLTAVIAGVIASSCGSSSDGSGGGGSKDDAPANGIWEQGDRWKLTVVQDGRSISPDGSGSKTELLYRFHVSEAPTAKRDTWLVHLLLDGAEGPYARGWDLFYREADGRAMVLESAGFSGEEPIPAEQAPTVLGLPFLEAFYESPPKDGKVDSNISDGGGALPPPLPDAPADAGGSGADSPPKDAPTIEETGAPTT